MVDRPSSFETDDGLGTTTFFTATLPNTTAVLLPSVAGAVIRTVYFKCDDSHPTSRYVEISIDGGTVWLRNYSGQTGIDINLRGSITQIRIRASANTTIYNVVLGFQPT